MDDNNTPHGQHDHGQHGDLERLCDVVVVGATPEDLAVALEHSQQGRSVIVIDAEQALAGTQVAREAIRSHGSEILAGSAVQIHRRGDGRLIVGLAGGTTVSAASVVGMDTPAGPKAAPAGAEASNEAEWDGRYSGDQFWSGKPNGSVVTELQALNPGTALDICAGEGGDAVWLAEQGWTVTASDISRQALAGVAAVAKERDLPIKTLRADANTPGAFASTPFDLVSISYPAIPRTPDNRAMANILAAVAPGGTLLVIGHDPDGIRRRIDTSTDSQPFDPDAYVQPDGIAAALADNPEFEVISHERRDRPKGSSTDDHHVRDVVLRAQRHG